MPPSACARLHASPRGGFLIGDDAVDTADIIKCNLSEPFVHIVALALDHGLCVRVVRFSLPIRV